ncbi:Fatty acid amide hydrolase 1 [Orchesella cincta]|uniref:Fatty acid amide hydrolase 1 n=1 Tax=Orchesella cincta TaxID=48709 RepID=A0A1D2MY38_ORCCI|nr:Fatty acid amide hydrolase 1 [Orchesella cincta]
MSLSPSSVPSSSDLETLETCFEIVSVGGRQSGSWGSKKLLISLVAGISVSYITFRSIHFIMRKCKNKQELAKVRQSKELERKGNFQRFQLQQSENYAEILSLSFTELQERLQSRALSAKAVLEAYIKRALELSEELNCVTEILPESLETAAKLDNMVLLQGPLHGMPFCLNDDIDLAGSMHSFSCSTNLPTSRPSSETAVMIDILMSHGAIPFCRTSTSITCLSFGGRNPFFGEIHNPINKTLSVGGSSCGTACLVQAGAAPLGIGTDRAGGARLPAHFTGITTLKPSKHRVSRRGCVQHCVGKTSVPCIMTKRVSDLIQLHRLVMDRNQQNKLDPKAVPLAWNMQVCESKQKLRIGYFTYFPAFPPLGDTEEALKKAKLYLESCGHIVVNFEPPDDLKCQQVWNDLMKVHTQRHVINENEKSSKAANSSKKQVSLQLLWADETRRVRKAQGDSIWRRYALEHIPGRKSSKDRAIEHMRATMNSDCDLWNTASLREQFVDEVLDSMNRLNVDVIICPAYGHVATTPENMLEQGLLPGVYTFVWNLLDLPAGVVKVWRESGKYLPAKFKESVGMPIGIQVVGRPYAEEMVLRVMNELDELNDDNDNQASFQLIEEIKQELMQ